MAQANDWRYFAFMKLLLIGDVVGKPGRAALLDRLQDLKEQHAIDFTVMNAENVAGGFSITAAIADLGNVNGVGVAVMNFLGRVFMQPADDPFRIANELVASLPTEVKVRIVDMHAEATSEKMAMGWFLDGRVSAVVGTHTHVQTADERILHEGTAYLTDLGMTGSYGGVIGMKKGDIIARFTSPLRRKPDHSRSEVRICGAVVDVDEETGRARTIERINLSHSS